MTILRLPCQGTSVSLNTSVVTCWPSLKRSSGPGKWPLYVVTEMIRLGAISIAAL